MPLLACGGLFVLLIAIGLVAGGSKKSTVIKTVPVAVTSSTEAQTTTSLRVTTTVTVAPTTEAPTTVTEPPTTEAPAPAITEAPAPPTTAAAKAIPAPANCPNGTYVNSSGNTVCSPYSSPSGPPAGATAQCKDGTYSLSQHRSGTCSGHGGVSIWL